MEKTSGGQGTFGEIGGFGERENSVVWGKLVGHGLELDIASSWNRLDQFLIENRLTYRV